MTRPFQQMLVELSYGSGSDGRLNGRERAELNRDLDNVAQRLRFERSDAERRY